MDTTPRPSLMERMRAASQNRTLALVSSTGALAPGDVVTASGKVVERVEHLTLTTAVIHFTDGTKERAGMHEKHATIRTTI